MEKNVVEIKNHAEKIGGVEEEPELRLEVNQKNQNKAMKVEVKARHAKKQVDLIVVVNHAATVKRHAGEIAAEGELMLK